MQIKSLKNLLWALPFFSFALGYQLLDYLYTVDKITTPNLVGKHLTEAVRISSDSNLNLRILGEQIDPDLPANTILLQKPTLPYIRPNQAIFVVISKKPELPVAPSLCGYHQAEITACLAQNKLKAKSYIVPSCLPKGQCVCQTPGANEPLDQQSLIVYLSAGSSNWMVMPNLTNLILSEVKDFLQSHNLKMNIKYLTDPKSIANYVIDQQPAAGTIINLDKLNQVDLYVADSHSKIAGTGLKIS